MAVPKTGTTLRFTADTGLAAKARRDDPDVSDDLPAEMVDLDLHPDTTVTVIGHDEDRDLVLVEWTDLQGNPRITSVERDDFNTNFVKE
jgi:hypothetical protein